MTFTRIWYTGFYQSDFDGVRPMQEKEPIERTQERQPAPGRRIVGQIRDDANAGYGDFYFGNDSDDLVRSLCLTPRDPASPDHLFSHDCLHDIHGDIRVLYRRVFNAI